MNKKNGFTLAEILVTLSVIGVISAITLPMITNSRPNQEMIMLKKAYYNAARVVSELINDDDFYPERADNLAKSGFGNTIISDMTGGNEAKYNGKTYKGDEKFCGLFAVKLNKAKAANCKSRVALSSGGNFTSGDGMIWSMPVSNFANDEYILVDVNGSKGNNCTLQSSFSTYGLKKCSGNKAPDQFGIKVGRFGEMEVVGDVEKEYVSSTKTNRTYIQIKSCAPNCK